MNLVAKNLKNIYKNAFYPTVIITDGNQTSGNDYVYSFNEKQLFEYAASLGGFRTLTEFVIYSVQEKAKSIIKEHDAILSSQKDRDIFFNALIYHEKPNANLKKAAKKYNEEIIK